MYVKCIDAHGARLVEGRVYETDAPWGDQSLAGHLFLKGALIHGGYRRDRFVEASKVDLLIAINKGEIKMEDK